MSAVELRATEEVPGWKYIQMYNVVQENVQYTTLYLCCVHNLKQHVTSPEVYYVVTMCVYGRRVCTVLNDSYKNCCIIKCICVQKHYSMMDLYNKQSLKTIQQHVTSINTQITKCRSGHMLVCELIATDILT